MGYYHAAMAFEDAYSRDFLNSLTPHIRALMLDAFVRAYESGEQDAKRWRYATDETLQDREKIPVGLAVAKLSEVVNEVGNYNVIGWGVAWDMNANYIVDKMVTSYEMMRKG